MNPSIYIPIILLWIIIFTTNHKRKAVAIRKIIEKRKMEGNTEMKELAERFIEKECVISSFDENHRYVGIIKGVAEGAILVEKDGNLEAINLDFVIRIREYPRDKKGKKKSIIFD